MTTSGPTIHPWNDSYVVAHPRTETVAVWPTLWQAEFHADLLNNGVTPSHAAAQAIMNGELCDETF